MDCHIITYKDYGTPGEKSTVTIPLPTITDINRDTVMGQIGSLRDAIEAITLGERQGYYLVVSANETVVPRTPFSPFAQRETKWLVKFHEDTATQDVHYLELPCADLEKLDPASTDKALLTDTDIAAFVTAFENVVTIGANAVVVDEILFVARKS